MTKSELAAQKCADLSNEVCRERKREADYRPTNFGTAHVFAANLAFPRFVEHVSDLCEQAIASGDTSGLDELVLREPVDEDLLERRKIVAAWYEAIGRHVTADEIRSGFCDDALRRGREIERGEGE